MKKTLFGAFIIVSGIVFFSALVYASGVWTTYGKITRIEDYGSSFMVYGTIDLSKNPAKCPSLSRARGQSETIKATAIAALMSGNRVKVKLSDTQCVGNNPVIWAIGLTDVK